VQPSPLEQLSVSGEAIGPLRVSVDRKHGKKIKKQLKKKITRAAPRSLKEAAAARLLGWRTKGIEAALRRRRTSTRLMRCQVCIAAAAS
jgi:hypothetical protein